jgi:CheY-like chemotaxis protein
LLIEKNEDLQLLIGMTMERLGRKVVAVPSGDAALSYLAGAQAPPRAIITDWSRGARLGGVELCQRLRRLSGNGVPIIVYAADLPDTTERLAADVSRALLREGSMRNLVDAVEQLGPARGRPE